MAFVIMDGINFYDLNGSLSRYWKKKASDLESKGGSGLDSESIIAKSSSSIWLVGECHTDCVKPWISPSGGSGFDTGWGMESA